MSWSDQAGDDDENMSVGLLPLRSSAIEMLEANSVRTVRDLRAMSDDEILRVPGVGRKTLTEIRSLIGPSPVTRISQPGRAASLYRNGAAIDAIAKEMKIQVSTVRLYLRRTGCIKTHEQRKCDWNYRRQSMD